MTETTTSAPAEMLISDIRIGDRVRKDMGDIDALATSIETLGLMHPPGVTPDGLLIFGHRRLQACIQLGMARVPVRIMDVADLLSAERDENQVRKDFTPSEAVAVARAIEDQLKAARWQRRSVSAKARWAREKGERVIVGESPTITTPLSRATASEAVGMCDQRYRQAKEVVEAAEQEAERFGDIVETMDATGNVKGAHTELRRRRDKAPERHPLLKKMRHSRPDEEIDRAITMLDGVCTAFTHINVQHLNGSKAEQWASDLKRIAAAINKFSRSISHVE